MIGKILLLAVCCSNSACASTVEKLDEVKAAVTTVKGKADPLKTTLQSSSEIIGYPGRVNEARQCVLDGITAVKAALTTIGKIPFPAFTAGVPKARKVIETGETGFKAGTSAIPQVTKAAETLTAKVTALERKATQFQSGCDSFASLMDNAKQLLDQLEKFLAFGAGLGQVQAALTAWAESLVPSLTERLKPFIVTKLAVWMNIFNLATWLSNEPAFVDKEPAFALEPLVETMGTSTKSLLDAASTTPLAEVAETTKARAAIHLQRAVRDVARFFGAILSGTPAEAAKQVLKDLLLRPLDNAATSLMMYAESEVTAFMDTSESTMKALKEEHSNVDVAAVVAAMTAKMGSAASAAGATLQAEMMAAIRTSAQSMGTDVGAALADCASLEPVPCLKAKVKEAMTKEVGKIATTAIARMKELLASAVTDVAAAVTTELNVDGAVVSQIFHSLTKQPYMGAGATVGMVQEQLLVKVEAAINRAKARAAEMVEGLPLSPAAAAVAGALKADASDRWRKALLAAAQAAGGSALVDALQANVDQFTNLVVQDIKTKIIADTKTAIDTFLKDTWKIAEDVRATKVTELERSLESAWATSLELKEKLEDLALGIKKEILKWVDEQSETVLATAISGSHSVDTEAFLGPAKESLEALKGLIDASSEPLSSMNTAMSGLNSNNQAIIELAQTSISALEAVCTPTNQFKTALTSLTSWLDAEYCLTVVLDNLPDCVGGQSISLGGVSFGSLPKVCMRDYVSKSGYCMVPSKLLDMELCATLGNPCLGNSVVGKRCLSDLIGSNNLRQCVGASTISSLVTSAFDAAIQAAGVDWVPSISFDVADFTGTLEFPELDNLVNVEISLPSFKIPKLVATKEGALTVEGWMNQGISIFTGLAAEAVRAILRRFRTAVRLANLPNAATLVDDESFKSSLVNAYAQTIAVNESYVAVDLKMVSRRLQEQSTGQLEATYTVSVSSDDEDLQAEEVEFLSQKFQYQKSTFLSNVQKEVKSYDANLASSMAEISVASVSDVEDAEESVQDTTTPPSGNIDGASAPHGPCIMLLLTLGAAYWV